MRQRANASAEELTWDDGRCCARWKALVRQGNDCGPPSPACCCSARRRRYGAASR